MENKRFSVDGSDFVTNLLMQSYQKASKGISPKDKTKQDDISDILNEQKEDKLEIVDDKNFRSLVKPILGSIEWEQVKSVKKNKYDIPADMWSDRLFFSYYKYCCAKIDEQYKDKIEYDIGIAVSGRMIKEIKKHIIAKQGKEFLHSTFKSYIEWFASNELLAIVNSGKLFSGYDLSQKRIINKFLVQNSKRNNSNIIQNEIIIKEVVDMSQIPNSYSKGGINFLSDYGIVICFKWIVEFKKKTEDQAYNVIKRFYKDAEKESKEVAENIINKTIKLSPYESGYHSKKIELLLSDLNIKGIIFKNKD